MILKTLFLHPLGPALTMALGALVLHWGPGATRAIVRFRRASAPARSASSLRSFPWSLVSLLCALAAGVVLVLLRVPPARASLRWAWQPLTVAGSALDWRLDGWNWLAALLILLLTLTALLLQEDVTAGDGRPARTLGLGAAGVAFVFAGNVVTLASCWVLLDAALALRLRPGVDDESAGRAWGLLSLAGLIPLGVLVLLGESGARMTLIGGQFDQVELALLWLAALIRAGVYPLHFWLSGSGRLDAGDRVALHLIGPTAGLWLLARVHEAAGPGWLRRPEWVALGALALLGSALVAWIVEDRGTRWRWVAINRASLVVMAASTAGVTGPSALLWSLITFSLGCALLAVGQATRRRWGWTLPAWLGVLTVWGLPGTPGFLARAALTLPAEIPVAIPLFGLVLVAETLLAAALWECAAGAEPPAPLTWGTFLSLGGALALLAAPLIAWGAAPRQLMALAGLPETGGSFPTLLQVLAGARRSVWIGLTLSGAAGIGIGLLRRRIFAGMRGWQQGVAAIVSLEWLYQGVSLVLALAASGLRYFAVLGEGEGYLGWLALGGLILWILIS